MAWTNNNKCYSFTETYGSNFKQLSANQDCSEVFIANYTPGVLIIVDSGGDMISTVNNMPINGGSAAPQTLSANNSYWIAPSATWTIRGITNASQVSAYAIVPGVVSYRTQKFSDMTMPNY